MFCPGCGHQNTTGAKFCPECGTRLPSSVDQPGVSEDVRLQVERMIQAALAAREAGELLEAEAMCREALRLCPESAAAHSALSVVLRDEGDTEAASLEMAEAVRLDPKQKPRSLWAQDLRRRLAALPPPHPAYLGLGVALTGFLIAFVVAKTLYAPHPQPSTDFLPMTATTTPGPAIGPAPGIAPQGVPAPSTVTPGAAQPGVGAAPPPAGWQGSASDRAAVDTSALGPGGAYISPSGAGRRGASYTGMRPMTPEERARTQVAAGNTGNPAGIPISLPSSGGNGSHPDPLPPVSPSSSQPGASGDRPDGTPIAGGTGSFDHSTQNGWNGSGPGAGAGLPPAVGPGYITLSAPGNAASTLSGPPAREGMPSFETSRSRAQSDYTHGDYEKAALEYKRALQAAPTPLASAQICQQLGLTYSSMGAPREAQQEYAASQQIYESLLSGPDADLARQSIRTLQKQRQLLDTTP